MKRLKFVFLFTALLAFGCATDDAPKNNTNNGEADQGNNGSGDMGTEELALTSILPDSGNVAGGTSIALTGTGFVSGMSVDIGANAATDVVVLGSTSATAVTPSGDLGDHDVTVTNPDSTSVTLSMGFSYLEAQDPNVGFCRLQAQSPATGMVGMPVAALYAVVLLRGSPTARAKGTTFWAS